ncbi:MAG: Gfo/Idh/MocA family protein [Bryobacteraceae bacterium]
MRRREFLAASTAAAQSASRLRIGFLGAAHSHARDKIEIARTSPDWELAGLWEPGDKVRAVYEKLGVPTTTREALLGDATIQVIAVESEVKPHASLAMMALDAGKHVHLEKPPSDNMADMRKLSALAKSKGLLLQMGYMWRFHPGINTAIEAARKGVLGDVFLVRGTMNTLIGPDRRPEWALFKGGQMFEQGCHLIDPMIRLLGAPIKIAPFLRHHGIYPDGLADNTVAVFEFPRAIGVICSSVLHPGATAHRCFEIFGSNGSAVVKPLEPKPVLVVDLARPAGPYRQGTQTVTLPEFTRYTGDFRELADAVRNRKPLSVRLEEDLLVQEALLRASEMWV